MSPSPGSHSSHSDLTPIEKLSSISLPVVDLPETSSVVDALLRFIYPIASPNLCDARLAFDVLLAAKKYNMSIVIQEAKQALLRITASRRKDALEVYAMACIQCNADIARAAAFDTLRRPLLGPYIPELEEVSGKAVMRLLEYHQSTRERITSIFTNPFQTLPPRAQSIIKRAEPYEWNRGDERPGKWWKATCPDMSDDPKIKDDGPLSESNFTHEILWSSVQTKGCRDCVNRLKGTSSRLVAIVRNEMEKAASVVELELPW